MTTRDPRDLVYVGDAHLEAEGEALDAFVAFLHHLGDTADRVVLMGDLFNLWIGMRDLERPHQRRVVGALADLRRRGVAVHYVEGNRDYRVRDAYVGHALDSSGDEGRVDRAGGRSLFAIHGDLTNEQDRQYRTWRRLSRSAPMWWGFRAFPPGRRLIWAERLEARLRRTNRDYKGSFPEAAVRHYAARWLARGHDAVVLGHFHVERDLIAEAPSPPGRILVLPEWTSSRRHLRVTPDGTIAFVDSGLSPRNAQGQTLGAPVPPQPFSARTEK